MSSSEIVNLDLCPHSKHTTPHMWHGLKLPMCGGSHLSWPEARTEESDPDADWLRLLERIQDNA